MLGLRALVLNGDYSPINLLNLHTIPCEDAMTRVFNGTCHIVETYDRVILTPSSKDMKWPSVIARNDFEYINGVVKLRRDSLYYRDHGICQFCERQISLREMTYDHVFPRHLGGKHEWTNLVTACTKCNTAKGNSLPVGIWKPKTKPWKPEYQRLLNARRKFPIVIDDNAWRNYIGPWEAEVKVRQFQTVL